jgi:hypothetical protein
MLRSTRSLQQKLFQRGLQSPYSLAQTDSLLGNKKEALQYLTIAYDQHDESMIQIESDAAFNNVHNEPAFRDLVARLGFPARK